MPAILLSGDHGKVARWRRDERLRRTARTRPDLLAALPPESLDARDRTVLAEVREDVTRETDGRVEATGPDLAE